MGILSWIVFGLVAGVLAKWIMPGKDPGGLIVTALLGIVGAAVGGYVGSLLGIATTASFSLNGIATATGGALLLLFAYRVIKKKR